MAMHYKDRVDLDVGNRQKDIQISVQGKERGDISLSVTGSGGTRDYNKLHYKPQINNVELIGNKVLQDLFPDGILINCGDSTGYPEPVIPPDISNVEGAEF